MRQAEERLPVEPAGADPAENFEYLDALEPALSEVVEYANIVILMACAAIELYLHELATGHFGDAFTENNLESLSVETKWQVIPRLIGKYEIDTEREPWKLIKEVFRTRNSLMHPKSHEVKSFEKMQKWDLVRRQHTVVAANAVKLLDLLAEETKKFDDSWFRVIHLLGKEAMKDHHPYKMPPYWEKRAREEEPLLVSVIEQGESEQDDAP
jgi:hypothetical protein